jgi:hypothetical protein
VRHGSETRPQRLDVAGLAAPQPAVTSARTRAAKSKRPRVADRPEAGQVKLDNDGKCACVSIHDNTMFDVLGADDHKGMFRVRLRIRKDTMEQLIANEPDKKRRNELKRYWTALPKIAETLQKHTGDVPRRPDEAWEDTSGDVFLVVDVPAVTRKPVKGKPWPAMPWELYWQW